VTSGFAGPLAPGVRSRMLRAVDDEYDDDIEETNPVPDELDELDLDGLEDLEDDDGYGSDEDDLADLA
jgi:hypothetical protein